LRVRASGDRFFGKRPGRLVVTIDNGLKQALQIDHVGTCLLFALLQLL
jgi:hypothetical protein